MQGFSDDSVFLTWNWIENSVVASPEIYWIFFKLFPAWFSKSLSRCRQELFEDKVSWNFLSFHIDFQNWAKRFWISGPKFWRYCQCCIIYCLRNFLMLMFFKKVLIFFAFWVFDWNFFWISTVIFRQGCQNCTLHFWMKTLRSEIFSSKKIFLLILYYFDQVNSQIFVTIFRPRCQSCFQRVKKAAWNTFSDFFSTICVILIGLSYDTCWKRKRLSKLLYYCLDKFFGVNICFWYKTNSPIFCRTLTEHLSVFLP